MVDVNGVAATVKGETYSASVPLNEGSYTITAVATDSAGNTNSVSITVTAHIPPIISILDPVNFSFVNVSPILFTGTVDDATATVTVNGTNAQVANRTYVVTGIPLQIGPNNIQVIGTDQTGNSATTNITVTREAITQPFIQIVSGDNQNGNIGTALAAPLVVQLLNGSTPVPNVHVIFKVTENDGLLTAGNQTRQLIAVDTDAQGQAQAVLTLGNRAGAGNNVVEAYGVTREPRFSSRPGPRKRRPRSMSTPAPISSARSARPCPCPSWRS